MGLDNDALGMILQSLRDFAGRHFTEARLLELDRADEVPVGDLRAMYGEDLGIHLLFIPEEQGGLGGGCFDVYRVCELLAGIDLGVAVGLCVGSMPGDVISRGGTPAQRDEWPRRIASERLLMAYAATEAAAGSDLGALSTVAVPVTTGEGSVEYHLTGSKQWISNGGIADAYSVLANAPGGPTWFLVEAGAPGFTHGGPEHKMGLRASNTASLFLDDVCVDAGRRVGAAEGQGLQVAQTVFGYSRVMVAALGLGAGWAALDRAIAYAPTRLQSGGPLSGKQGYIHKLIVPNVVRLEAARSFIEESAERIDDGAGSLNTEGAIAKYMATEAGYAAADASIQALGGYGYVREYLVEKIARDVRITRIFEGTSEIMEVTIARARWQDHLKTHGRYYEDEALKLEALHIEHADVGADVAALASHTLAAVLERCREAHLTRHQHILFRLGELIAYAECAGSLSRRAARAATGVLHPKAHDRFSAEVVAALARIFARDAALKVAERGRQWCVTSEADTAGDTEADLDRALAMPAVYAAQAGLLKDMNMVAGALFPPDDNRNGALS